MSNVNLNLVGGFGQTGRINVPSRFDTPVAILLAPKGTVIPAAQMVDATTLTTYIQQKLINDSDALRWYLFGNLDKFTEGTKAAATEDTGIYQKRVFKFAPEYSFRYLANVYNFIEALKFDGCEYAYDAILIDKTGTLQGTYDTSGGGGLQFRALTQFFVDDIKLKTPNSDTALTLYVTFADRTENNDNLNFFETGGVLNPAKLAGLLNLWLTDVSATVQPTGYDATKCFVITAKAGQGAIDWFQTYGSSVTAACFIATDLNTGSTLTISSVAPFTMIVADQTYNVIMGTLSAAPTATHKVQVKLAAPSVINGVITGADVVCEIINPNVNGIGGNSAVKTF
jgi:hypothetical protein